MTSDTFPKVRVVSWNVELGAKCKQAAQELTESSDLQNADVVLLQEMDRQGTETIAAALEANYVYNCVAKHPDTGRDFGNAILSPWPITNVELLALPYKALIQGQRRSACRAQLTLPAGTLTAYSVHTEIATMRLSRRVKQFKTVADDVIEHAADTVIVGGDFNTPTSRSVLALAETMRAAGLDHASRHSGASFKRAGRKMPLDHIFARNLRCEASGVVWSATASDHFPVWAVLATPK